MQTKPKSAKTTTFSVRVSRNQVQFLESTARASGLEVAQLLRQSLDMLRDYTADGTLVLPVDIHRPRRSG